MPAKSKLTGLGVALGAALGTVFGVMAGHMAVWLAVGIAIGVAIGSAIRPRGQNCPECDAVHKIHEQKLTIRS